MKKPSTTEGFPARVPHESIPNQNRWDRFIRYFVRPIFAVALREVRILTRYKTFFVAGFFWPIIFPFAFVFIGRGLAGPSNEGIARFESLTNSQDFASFLIIGNLVWMFVNINLWTGGTSLKKERDRGTLDTHWVTPVSRFSLVLGATLSSLMVNFLPIVVAIMVYGLIGFLDISVRSLPEVIITIAAVLPFLTGFLIIMSALTLRVRNTGTIVQVMRALLSILCGLQFPLAVLPSLPRNIGAVIPLTRFVSVLRSIVSGGDKLIEHVESLIYVVVTGVIVTFAAVLIFEMVKNNIRRKGLVSGY